MEEREGFEPSDRRFREAARFSKPAGSARLPQRSEVAEMVGFEPTFFDLESRVLSR